MPNKKILIDIEEMKENPPSEEFGSRRFDGISYAPSCCSSPRKMKVKG